MKITLAGDEKFNLTDNYLNIKAFEDEIGVKLLPFIMEKEKANISITDIVSFYYHLQDGTSYNRDALYEKVSKDGLFFHLIEVAKVANPIIFGDKKAENIVADTKKK